MGDNSVKEGPNKISNFELETLQKRMEKEKSPFDSSDLVYCIYKWKKALAIITVSVIIISTIVAFLITPKYKAIVVLFPVTTNSISKSLLSETGGEQKDILKFGEEEEAEQTLQILNSDGIRERITKKYNLMDHYRIDPSEEFKLTKLYEEYEDNISFERTEFLSVKITVFDTDPQIAADIANDIASLLDSTKNRMQNERASLALGIVENEYMSLNKEVEVMDDSLKVLRRLGINDYETQSEVFNEQYATALAKGSTVGIKMLEEKLKILSEYGGAYVKLRESLGLRLKRLSDIKSKYQELKVDALQKLPHKFIVDRAYKAEKKSYPIRWLIVLTSTFTTLLLSLFLIFIFENYHKIERKISNSNN